MVSLSNPERPGVSTLQTAWLHGRKTQEPSLGPPSSQQPSGFLGDRGGGSGHNLAAAQRGDSQRREGTVPSSGEGSWAGSYPSPEGIPAAGAGVRQDWLRPRIFWVSSAVCVKGLLIPSLISSPAPLERQFTSQMTIKPAPLDDRRSGPKCRKDRGMNAHLLQTNWYLKENWKKNLIPFKEISSGAVEPSALQEEARHGGASEPSPTRAARQTVTGRNLSPIRAQGSRPSGTMISAIELKVQV